MISAKLTLLLLSLMSIGWITSVILIIVNSIKRQKSSDGVVGVFYTKCLQLVYYSLTNDRTKVKWIYEILLKCNDIIGYRFEQEQIELIEEYRSKINNIYGVDR